MKVTKRFFSLLSSVTFLQFSQAVVEIAAASLFRFFLFRKKTIQFRPNMHKENVHQKCTIPFTKQRFVSLERLPHYTVGSIKNFSCLAKITSTSTSSKPARRCSQRSRWFTQGLMILFARSKGTVLGYFLCATAIISVRAVQKQKQKLEEISTIEMRD